LSRVIQMGGRGRGRRWNGNKRRVVNQQKR
jgi:hypothetical protein